MAFNKTIRLFCLAIFCTHFLITVTSAKITKSVAKITPTEKIDITHNSLGNFDDRSLRAGASSGRSLTLAAGLLLFPLFFTLLPALILLVAIFMPIPVITGREQTRANKAINLSKIDFTIDECIERISCEISNFTRNYQETSWIPRTIESYLKNSPWWVQKASNGFRTLDSCRKFACHPFKAFLN